MGGPARKRGLARFVNVVYYLIVIQEHEAGPRERRHRSNLARIVDAASQLVFEEGLDALSVKRVADLADYTPGALYRYFPSKDALLAAVVERVLEDLGARLRAAGESTSSPLARVVREARAYRDFAQASPHAFALVASMLADPRYVVADEPAARSILTAALAVAAPVVLAFGAAQAEGQLAEGDARARVLALFAALQGALALRKYEARFPALVETDVVFDTLLRSLLRGFGADETALEAAFGDRI